MENYKKESALKVAKRNATKIPFKHRLKISTFQLSPGNRLHRIKQSGVASSTKELHSLKQRESVKQKKAQITESKCQGIIIRLSTVRDDMLYMQPTV